ncbi:MAG: M48 family metallopeptidase [Pseudomonadales bacterium]
MKIAQGVYHDGKTSVVHQVELLESAQGEMTLQGRGTVDIALPTSTFEQLRISSRIGNTPRYIYFPNGGKFETEDSNAIDHWLEVVSPGVWLGLAHRLESHFRYVLPGLIVVIVSTWMSIQYLIPVVSAEIVQQLPSTISEKIGKGSLQLMDKHLFIKSRLSERRQQYVQALFQQYFVQLIEDYSLVLNFRYSEKIGANAFALPSGDLVFTDDIVDLAGNDFELLAVMAHEVGHVQKLHMMRRVVQDSLLVFLLTMVAGDVSTVSSVALATPTILLEMAYSRDFEREADYFTLVFLQEYDIDPINFSNMMARIELAAAQKSAQQESAVSISDGDYSRVAERLQYYLSSHPDTDERSQAFGEPSINVSETILQ